ncbi:MAG: RagB/SusD family nutrient uptake outer membrane protein [Bacteroidota bacterium]|nr:RagB/SusD family nutrient uptake outer membrane protein [Bacteroidota bacterium]MDP4252436.1 RagB/SusD family nutrient uptake outer membrane protein [Bacteroidota bacterium]MDP4259337.1 RagB/SusD family nutrient uptake outer membrane protein [Bacteroidota bacterium]
MKFYRNKFSMLVAVLAVSAGCTKLNEGLKSSFPYNPSGGTASAGGVLTSAYGDLSGLFHNQDQVFSLEENTTDECLVPTRGGDWDDNGVWRVLHAHAWDATHGQAASVFSNLGTLESDATTVLASNPSAEQAAEATFLRSFAQFYFLDLYGQVPYRTVPRYNTVDAAPVMTPAQAIDTLVNNLTGIIGALNPANQHYQVTPDAARFLLMKVLLNKQAFLNRQTPAAAVQADMEQVRTLGMAILGGITYPSAKYPLTASYFDNFGPNNGGFGVPGTGGQSSEIIFSYANNGTATNPNGTGNGGITARWMMGLHYNSWDKTGVYGGAGWNGFSTIADLYNSFDATDTRKGNVPYPAPNGAGVSPISGLNVGLAAGQQKNEAGQNITDRKGNPLVFAPTVNLVETNVATLEGDGIRVMKYYPDYAHYTSTASNQLVFFRAADVWLMIAEADLNGASGGSAEALSIVNKVHATRGAAPLAALTLVNKGNLYDATTLLAERQKELYFESWRRQDLIRFGVFLQPWALKTADDPKYLLFPIPATQLIANPNLKQNPGY